MAAIVDNLLRAKRAAEAVADEAHKAAPLPMEVFLACMTDTDKVLAWLNERGDINAGEAATQATLLIAAAVTGNALLIEVLLAKGAAVDQQDSFGQTPLMFAALYGQHAMIRPLAAAGATLNIACKAGLTAEQHAVRAGHWGCVRELRGLLRCPLPGRSDRKRLRREDAWVLPEDVAAAADQGNTEAVIAWLDCGGHVDATHQQASCTLLMCASAEGREELAAELLRRDADPDLAVAGGYTPLMLAASHGHAGIVRRLLRAGARLGVRLADGATPTRLAQAHGHAACVRAIKEHLGQLSAGSREDREAHATLRRMQLRGTAVEDAVAREAARNVARGQCTPVEAAATARIATQWLSGAAGRRFLESGQTAADAARRALWSHQQQRGARGGRGVGHAAAGGAATGGAAAGGAAAGGAAAGGAAAAAAAAAGDGRAAGEEGEGEEGERAEPSVSVLSAEVASIEKQLAVARLVLERRPQQRMAAAAHAHSWPPRAQPSPDGSAAAAAPGPQGGSGHEGSALEELASAAAAAEREGAREEAGESRLLREQQQQRQQQQRRQKQLRRRQRREQRMRQVQAEAEAQAEIEEAEEEEEEEEEEAEEETEEAEETEAVVEEAGVEEVAGEEEVAGAVDLAEAQDAGPPISPPRITAPLHREPATITRLQAVVQREPAACVPNTAHPSAATACSAAAEDSGGAEAREEAGAVRSLCVVCMERPMDATIVHGDTGHICCCLACAHSLKSAGFSCPVCRVPIAAVIRHFVIES